MTSKLPVTARLANTAGLPFIPATGHGYYSDKIAESFPPPYFSLGTHTEGAGTWGWYGVTFLTFWGMVKSAMGLERARRHAILVQRFEQIERLGQE